MIQVKKHLGKLALTLFSAVFSASCLAHPIFDTAEQESEYGEAHPIVASSKVDDFYTSTHPKVCEQMPSQDEIGGYGDRICPGIYGYKIRVVTSDVRDRVYLITPNNKQYAVSRKFGGFSEVGAKLHWQVKKIGNKRHITLTVPVYEQISEQPVKKRKVEFVTTIDSDKKVILDPGI